MGRIISKPERWDRVGFVPGSFPRRFPFPTWLPVLKTMDLVKIRGCLKAKLYCKAEGSVFKSRTPLPTSPSALLGGKERFLVKPCDGNAGSGIVTGADFHRSLQGWLCSGAVPAGFAGSIRSRLGSQDPSGPGWVRRIRAAPGEHQAGCPASPRSQSHIQSPRQSFLSETPPGSAGRGSRCPLSAAAHG